MRVFLVLILTIGALSLLGCGSSESTTSTPVTSTPQETAPSPPVTQEMPSTSPTGTQPLQENSGGTAIKANELGPQ